MASPFLLPSCHDSIWYNRNAKVQNAERYPAFLIWLTHFEIDTMNACEIWITSANVIWSSATECGCQCALTIIKYISLQHNKEPKSFQIKIVLYVYCSCASGIRVCSNDISNKNQFPCVVFLILHRFELYFVDKSENIWSLLNWNGHRRRMRPLLISQMTIILSQ